jgi:uracil-DNA glycosylase
MSEEVILAKGWDEVLKDYLVTDVCKKTLAFVDCEYKTKKVFPEMEKLFQAFKVTPFSSVNVVILGQDPYHDDGQACGLCFSVPQGSKLPPSLKNIYKEVESDIGVKKDFTNGSLEAWAKSGVFLLNSILSVVAHSPASHRKIGWENFTDEVIKTISRQKTGVVFMLWGNYARSKKELIDETKHLVLEAPHPSPLSAYSGFFGCKHFSKCNAYLKRQGKAEIIWL